MEKNNKKYLNICNNCGLYGHIYKFCNEPITSWGIILINCGNIKINHEKNININNIKIDYKFINKYEIIYSNLLFLMISRKYSVGYSEFIRGKYKIENIDQIYNLFKQMLKKEILKVKESLNMINGFDFLWKDFWGEKYDNLFLIKDKFLSSNKYNILKYIGAEGPEINLNFIIYNVNIEYDIEEWGFPKGRKNKYETDIECAIREFQEESGYNFEDIKIINEINPIIEQFIGTNNVKYKHIYYVAELLNKKQLKDELTKQQKNEIGGISFMNFETANKYIREYHISKKDILIRLLFYYIQCYNKNIINK